MRATYPDAKLGRDEIERFRRGDILLSDEQANRFCDLAISALSEIVENHDIRLEQIALTLEGCVEMKPEMFKSVARELRTLKGTIPSAIPRSGEFINMPDTLHKDTRYLVILFAEAMALKLNKAQEKYGYDNGWAGNDWEAECRERLHEHLAKGDPRDVANYCAFMWHHGWSTKAAPPTRPEKLYSADGRDG